MGLIRPIQLLHYYLPSRIEMLMLSLELHISVGLQSIQVVCDNAYMTI